MGQVFKNVASQKIRVFAFADAGHATLDPGEPVTGDAANISAYTAVDNGTLGASNDAAPTEVDATNAPGVYEFDPTQAETNGNVVEWYPKSSTAGVQVVTIGGNVQQTAPPNFPALGIASDGDISGNVDGNVVGSVASVTGAVGSVTGNVGGIAGTITTLDALDTAQDTQHSTTRGRIGYIGPHGLGVYYDDGAGNTNTTLDTDGIGSNPVSTLAAATTLATSLGANRIYIKGQSTLTLTGQTITDYDIVGMETADAATVNLGTAASQSVLTRVRITNCTVYGEHDASDRLRLADCIITDAPAAEVTFLHAFATNCILSGDFELDTSNDNVFISCSSGVAGNAAPVVTATGASGTAQFRDHRGGAELKSLSASHVLSIDGRGQVIFNADCNVNAAVTIRGHMSKTDNTAGMSNLTETARIDRLAINAEADTALSDYDPPTRTEATSDKDAILTRLGTPAGADVSADIAAVKTDTAATLVDTGTTLPAILGTPSDLGGGADLANNLSDMAGATFSTTTDSQEAIRNRGDAAWTTGGGSVEIKGIVTRVGSTYYVSFVAIGSGAMLTSGLSSLVCTFYDEDGTDMTFSGTPTEASGFMYATGTLGTALVDNRPLLVKVGATYGGTAYSTILPAVAPETS